MDRSQIHRVSVADQVATILRQRILDGELRPGTPLPEIPLSSSLGVSRNTMREAVRILSIEGLLRRSIHRGVSVAQLSLKDVKEIYHVRRMLEIPAVLAASNTRADVLDELRASVQQYEDAVKCRDWARAVTCDLHFHATLIRFHNNKRLDAFYQKVIGEVRMGMVLVDRGHDDPETLIPVHLKLFQLLAAGKIKQCATMLTRHLDDSEARLGQVMAAQAMAGENPSRDGMSPVSTRRTRAKAKANGRSQVASS
jgi:DNA-binding GntR family transcriptional regulator